MQTNGVVDPAKQRADTRIQLGSNIRTFSSTLADFRGEAQDNRDLSILKKFSLGERVGLQVRGEFGSQIIDMRIRVLRKHRPPEYYTSLS